VRLYICGRLRSLLRGIVGLEDATTHRDAPRRARTLADDLAEATWAQADQALALAWREVARLETNIAAAQRSRAIKAAGAAAGKRFAALAADALLVRQALDRAARLRGLRLFGAKGQSVRYDAARHDLEGARATRDGAGRLARPGVERRVGEHMIVLARAVFRPARVRQ
jgi:hypothetical protein